MTDTTVKIDARKKLEMAREVASAFPAPFRSAARDMFVALFDAYEAAYPRELAGSLAVLLAGGYSAYHHRVLPEEFAYAALAQWRALLAQGGTTIQIPRHDVESTYIRSVMIGMHLLASTAKNQALAEDSKEVRKLRAGGEQALRELLKVDADRVELTKDGFRIL